MLTCEFCGKKHSGTYGSGRFCCSSCAHKKSAQKTDEIKKRISKGVNRYHRLTNTVRKKKTCNVCGQVKCCHPQICKSSFLRDTGYKTLLKLGFNNSALGTITVYKEYRRIKNILYKDYVTNELSYIDICKKYGIPSARTVTLLFRFFNIKVRSQSDAVRLSYINNKAKPVIINHVENAKFCAGYHMDWQGKSHFYRSSLENKVMSMLDSKRYEYETETLNIKYFDTQKKKYRSAYPDVYIPKLNMIIEIKSNYTYNQQNMIDKARAYRKLGFNFRLYLNGKLYKRCISNPGADCL